MVVSCQPYAPAAFTPRKCSVKQSRYRPGLAQRVPGSCFLDFVTTAQDGGKLSALRTDRLYPQEMLRKAVPLQAWIGPEGSRELSYLDFVITAQDGGRLSALRTGRLYPQEMLRKAVPLQAWSGPEGSRKLRFPDFVTTAQDGGKVVSLRHRPPLPPGNTPGTHFC